MKVQYKDKILEAKRGQKVSDLLRNEIQANEFQVVGCIVNNEYENLEYEIEDDCNIKLIDISTKNGMKIYRATLVYIMGMAFEKLYPNEKLSVNYQLSNAMFCDTDTDTLQVTQEVVDNLNKEMKNIIEQDLEIKSVVMTRKEAQEFYEKTNTSKGRLQFDLKANESIKMYYCNEYYNYFYGTLANRTGCVKVFEVIKYSDGFLIRYPSTKNPNVLTNYQETKKLYWALNEYDDIHRILNVNTVYKLNKMVEEDKIKNIIMLDEALHEKKIANIADNIAKRKKVKMVLIAGPSSSGKTTFAQRLGIQLKLNGIKPVTISVDNYFVERKDNPLDENGNYDFECIEAIDLELFNSHLVKLLNGEEIEMPEFDFHTGQKKYNGKKLKMNDDEILVIEGIHCLNDKLTSQISKEQKYKIYISALTVLNMDRYNRISTTDTRLVRRIVRDHKFRGYTAKHTINTWDKVNRGEEQNIFPFQEEADSIFNTSLIYELGVLKPIVEPLLNEILKEEPEHAEALRIIDMLKYFKTIPAKYVPTNSLLKEFIGGGDFEY